MINKLPILSTFIEALSLPCKYYRSLLRVGFPTILTGLTFIMFNYFFPNNDKIYILTAIDIILVITLCLSLVMSVVGCHRVVLLGESVVRKSSLLNWTGNEIKYIGWWILISLLSGLMMILPSIPLLILVSLLSTSLLGVGVIILFFCLVASYIASRCSLVLPSSAIGIHGKSFGWSWRLSSGNGWRLTLLLSFLPFIMHGIFSLLPIYDSLFFALFYGTLWLAIGVVEIGLLSLSYRFLVSNLEKERPQNLNHEG